MATALRNRAAACSFLVAAVVPTCELGPRKGICFSCPRTTLPVRAWPRGSVLARSPAATRFPVESREFPALQRLSVIFSDALAGMTIPCEIKCGRYSYGEVASCVFSCWWRPWLRPDTGPRRESPTAEAQKLLDTGRLDEALKVLDTLAQQQPEPAGVERMRGMAFYEQGQIQSSATAFEHALAQDPGGPRSHADGRCRAFSHR